MGEQEQLELRRRREEELMAATLAAGFAAQAKEIQSMSVSRTPVSKAPALNPRNFIKTPPAKGQPQQRPQMPIGDPLAPRVMTIPLPKGVNPEEIIPPEMRRGGPLPVVEPIFDPVLAIPAPQMPLVQQEPPSNQLELNFNRQATLNEIYSQLDSLNSKLDTVLSYLKKSESNGATTRSNSNVADTSPSESSDKKKSETPG